MPAYTGTRGANRSRDNAPNPSPFFSKFRTFRFSRFGGQPKKTDGERRCDARVRQNACFMNVSFVSSSRSTPKLRWLRLLPLLLWVLGSPGCSLFPEKRTRDRIHNPFPQIKRVAVLPFFNQSEEPTLDADAVTSAYYASLQSVPGFEVLPVGVTSSGVQQYLAMHGEPTDGAAFQHLANFLDVEAVVVGSVTDYDAYYPPRMAMTVHWYAADPGFHPVPAGYGLPWGTEAEKRIPRRIVREAEFEMARSQLRTQAAQPALESVAKPNEPATVPTAMTEPSPDLLANVLPPGQVPAPVAADTEAWAPHPSQNLSVGGPKGYLPVAPERAHGSDEGWFADAYAVSGDAIYPPGWPQATDLIPDPPTPMRPIAQPQTEPILSHTKLYRGNDAYLTDRLADYVETADEARPSGWQGYLKRSDDFVRFCCHLHITEMLESRGGVDQSDLILRWPLDRY